MEVLMDISCLKFHQRTSEEQYLVITNKLGQGCWADTGRQEKALTYMNLAQNCTMRIGTILHELMHVLGFLHQHTRPDRDLHLCVHYENILPQPVALYNYEKVRPWNKLAFPLPYDFESITHYTPDMYSMDPGRLPTMSPKHPFSGNAIGQRNHLSDYDVLAIHFLYCV
ncbi:AGAP001931-PA-like protein [Anopheles sinensis]|uniref:Metalloendopeptidase n=1 Tax=Anopheles sinensis TaxID=74873 RepID=A0A084VS20_ANOSI|nr:AGAP001931-PA-like protein [Anopheles sinensis]